jgi:hypothetical protein
VLTALLFENESRFKKNVWCLKWILLFTTVDGKWLKKGTNGLFIQIDITS